MNNLTPELIARAKAARSAEELLELAKENGLDLTEDDAKTFFEQLHANAEVSDDELEAVSGGGICQDVIDFFRGINGRNDGGCSYYDKKSKLYISPDRPVYDSSITPPSCESLPGDPNNKNKIEFL
jgi:predicted ribosomally synthesized peptide with nif11-like leader